MYVVCKESKGQLYYYLHQLLQIHHHHHIISTIDWSSSVLTWDKSGSLVCWPGRSSDAPQSLDDGTLHRWWGKDSWKLQLWCTTSSSSTEANSHLLAILPFLRSMKQDGYYIPVKGEMWRLQCQLHLQPTTRLLANPTLPNASPPYVRTTDLARRRGE